LKVNKITENVFLIYWCVKKIALILGVYRILKPGGQVNFCHYDWDSQLINGIEINLIRRIIAIFSDWKQEWMTESNGWMGHRFDDDKRYRMQINRNLRSDEPFIIIFFNRYTCEK